MDKEFQLGFLCKILVLYRQLEPISLRISAKSAGGCFFPQTTRIFAEKISIQHFPFWLEINTGMVEGYSESMI